MSHESYNTEQLYIVLYHSIKEMLIASTSISMSSTKMQCLHLSLPQNINYKNTWKRYRRYGLYGDEVTQIEY